MLKTLLRLENEKLKELEKLTTTIWNMELTKEHEIKITQILQIKEQTKINIKKLEEKLLREETQKEEEKIKNGN